ncbi:MFS transporter (plasmid) [Vagococcus lutrae]|uniref:MFS transporter n=1 Tax=Vagococcus lutrae TaxID=81947 RepID=UPI00232AA251|nr:MFS transporter [Vagococcus lutrae]WCG06120.1 MFS transporter [Vagococcus lutrae]
MLKKEHKIFKVSLLSISILLMSAPIIAAAIPDMVLNFSDYAKSSVETLLTIPNFGIILGLLISPLMIQFVGKKNTVIVGLIMALCSGVLPGFILNYKLILLSRFIFGVGIGLFNSLAVSLLAEIYEGEDLSTMMGYQSMAGALGSAGLSFLVSYLVTLGWEYTFFAYFIIIPVLFLFIFFVEIPESIDKDNIDKDSQSATTARKTKINTSVLKLCFLIFFVFAFFLTMVVKLPEYIIANEIGTLSDVSIITGISTLVGIPVGMFYGKIYSIMKKNLLPFGLILVAIGFYVIRITTNIYLVVLGVVLSGIGFSLTIPYIYTWTAQVAPKESINLSYTYLIIATNIGVFISPMLLNIVGEIFNNKDSSFSLIVASSGFLFLAIIMTIKLNFKNRKEELE